VIAERADVQPSTLIRPAQSLVISVGHRIDAGETVAAIRANHD